MPTLTIKNIPEDRYVQLKRYAAINRRSVNSEVILCIERAIRSRKIHPEAYLARVRRLREKWIAPILWRSEFRGDVISLSEFVDSGHGG